MDSHLLYQFAFVVLVTSTAWSTVETLECISCIAYQITGKDMGTKDRLDKQFAAWYDSDCARNPTEVARTVSCDGSCIQSTFTARIARQDQMNSLQKSEPMEVHFFLRTCNPIKSARSGCKQLSANALPSVLQYLNVLFMIGLEGTARTGKVCYCNSDRCNEDTTVLDTLERGKLRLCHDCLWMKYSSDDTVLERDLQAKFGSRNATRHDENCRVVTHATPSSMCNGACETTEIRVQLTTKARHLGGTKNADLYLVNRYCTGIKTTPSSHCQDISGSEPVVKQLLPVEKMENSDLTFTGAVASICTCDSHSCNDVSRVSLTSAVSSCSFYPRVVMMLTVLVVLTNFYW
ncbi:uncharacterized protein LOC106153028 [Lingula anatina]|uniref:Uncharacterized protein LOC106153028 n=1 Tax=Lingula anatina TaxID=7574 RepID=A0A1S3H8C2_LINAN|nr:uncharacterized protein LOC106153028 [Lingula anatina]|eukprot:XP_013382248.2 uncharacterized protein LOC106153028 [Lingula anatina]